METNQAEVTAVAAVAQFPVPATALVARRLPGKPQPKKLGGKLANKDGISRYETRKGVRYLVQVRLAGRKPVSKSFDVEADAIQWKREQTALLAPTAKPTVPSLMTMPDLFAKYIELSEQNGSALPEHQLQMFTRLSAHPVLKGTRVIDMNPAKAFEYCRARKADVDPSTIQSEYARICISIEKVALWLGWGKFDPLDGVRQQLMDATLIAESKKRDRRPTPTEMSALVSHFAAHHIESRRVMADIVQFAALNAFRRGEIPELRWDELDVDHSVIVCWRKDSASEGGKRRTLVPVLPEAMAIILRQPRTSDFIFPVVADTISGWFTDACRALKIEDLRFHDLRHEAITTAAQLLGDSEGMQLSGHKTHRHYARYVNFQKEDVSSIAKKLAGVKLKLAA